MSLPINQPTSCEGLIAGMMKSAAYPEPDTGSVELQETHISLVFLVGEFAYKVKKAIKTDFLDYSSLAKRKRCCEEELRLDRRYAPDLYLGVVPICLIDGRFRVEAKGEPIEYAVKMRRFPKGALLSERIDAGRLTTHEVLQLAGVVADFHRDATICERNFASGWPQFIVQNTREMMEQVVATVTGDAAATLESLQTWSDHFLAEHSKCIRQRVTDGFIRECHGDLHLQNVVFWQGRLIPFDGIEFNERLRWIDVLSDAAFLAMDLASRGHLEFARSFINAYLAHTGDYASTGLLRWFLFYRATVRALVASMRAQQSEITDSDRKTAESDCRDHIDLAYRFTLKEPPRLWITHGFSGSGKTTQSELLVQRHDAIRVRSDVERKRLFGLSPTDRPSAETKKQMYDEATNRATYTQLRRLAETVLRAGYSVVVDATFLKQHERNLFFDVANQEGVSFAILDCHADSQTLRRRVADRMARNQKGLGSDASDADLQVLDHQLTTHEPLTDAEREFVVDVSDLALTPNEHSFIPSKGKKQ